MLLAAFIDAGADQKIIQRVVEQIPSHYTKCKSLHLEVEEVKVYGFRACRVNFKIGEDSHGTEAKQLVDASEAIATASEMSSKASSFAVKAVRTLIETESKLHGVALDYTHLHEAGSADTLADIFGVAAACDSLNVFDGTIMSTPVAIGQGTVTFSHGTLAVPAPAVLEIARRYHIPITGSSEPVELATPTGMAMLANMAHQFTEAYPAMIPHKVGYGAGRFQLQSSPNFIRVTLGSSSDNMKSDVVQLLETNLDDVSGEVLAHAMQTLVDSGARDVWITPAQFKKNRPGQVLHVLCDVKETEEMTRRIIEETGTLGVRYKQWHRFVLERDIETLDVEIEGKRFQVRVKIARDGPRVVRLKPEFEDIRQIAKETGLPARRVEDIVLGKAEVYRGA